MTGPGSSEGTHRGARSRGRPSPDAAAQIDREILHAAQATFFQHGYERTSMAMIVKAAGVSKTTLYARYATKADLFAATVKLSLDRIQEGQREAVSHDEIGLVDGLTTFGADAIRISLMPIWTNYERMGLAEGRQFPEFPLVLLDRIELGRRHIATFIAQCAEREGIPCRDPDAVARIFMMALRGYYAAALLRGEDPTEEERHAFAAELVRTLVAGRADW